jgi:phosphoesterase RecJ-like protein
VDEKTARIAGEAAALMRQARSVLVVSHANPDGDAIGSQLALGQLLEPHCEKVTLLGSSPVPPRYAWLPGSERIRVADTCEERFPLVVALECGNLERTGIHGIIGQVVINIDHHQQNDQYGQLNWVDPGFSSVGEMIYHVALELTAGAPLPLDAAVNLYTAILTDTGSFRFSNTSRSALAICGELVALGVQPAEVSSMIYENHSSARLRLMGRVLSTLVIDAQVPMGWVVVSQADLLETGAAPADVEGLVSLPRSIGQLEVAALFREQADSSFRVSLRSKRRVDVSHVAAHFGGGGHKRAAGLSTAGPLDAAVAAVTREVRQAFALLPGDGI